MLSPLLGADALPSTVVVGGRAYPIRSDFRDGIRFESMMYDDALPDGAKTMLALGIYFGTERPPAEHMAETIAAMLDFYRCGKADNGYEGGDTTQLYDFAYDYDLIYAAFLSAYGVNLLDRATHLHWWEFRAMLTALPEDCQLMRVIGYRAAKPVKGMSPEQRAHVSKMKRIHALPGSRSNAPHRIRSEEELAEVLAEVARMKGETT